MDEIKPNQYVKHYKERIEKAREKIALLSSIRKSYGDSIDSAIRAISNECDGYRERIRVAKQAMHSKNGSKSGR